MSGTPNPTRRKVGIAGCKHTTLELIRALGRYGIALDHCITIDPERARGHEVSGYLDLRPHLEDLEIPWTLAETYSLKADGDQCRISALGLDLLLVMGWQRLIPAWLLENLPLGAFGMHGSSKPLPHGRGRSPLNWSIITGRDTFHTHLIRYTPEVDAGPIVGRVRFDINPHDTALTLHKKNQIAMVRLLVEEWPNLISGRLRTTPQPAEDASYWPRRRPEDGLIDWEASAEDVCRLVRGVTRPFPGAFAYLDDDASKKVMIWQAQPFDRQLDYPQALPGEITEVFDDGTFVARCGESTVLVTESAGHEFGLQDVGRRLGRAGVPCKEWPTLPE